jgi:zinc protease
MYKQRPLQARTTENRRKKMKKIVILLILSLALCTTVAYSASETPSSAGSQLIKQYTKESIKFNIPKVGVEVERVELPNGMILYLYEDHRFPVFSLQAVYKCGGIYDPDEKNGLSGLVGTVMRSGGTKTISADSLNNILDYIGGSIDINIGGESGAASLGIMSKDIDLGLKLFADVLRNPAFPQDKLDLAKSEIKNSIKRRNDDLGTVGGRYSRNVIYGSHPYGRIQEWASIKGITVQDMVDYHQKYFSPNNMILGISGDFKKSELIGKIKQLFGDWQKSNLAIPTAPVVNNEYKPGVYQVHKETNQTNVNICELGVKQDNPDVPAIDVMNFILGGGSFSSRIMSRVRSDEGLSYRTGSTFETNSRDYGMFNAYCQTKTATTYKAVSIILEEIKKMQTNGPTEQEVKEAKESLINRFPFRFDTSGKILRSLVSLEFDGKPADYFQKYIDALGKVTLADVKAAAAKYLKSDQLSIVVVGNPQNFEKPLSEFGKIIDIELTPPDVN